MSPVVSELRLLRDAIEEDLDRKRVDENLARGVYGYVGCLIRLVEDGDRDPARSLNEARSAAGFLLAVPRLPDPPHPHLERPVMPRVIPAEAMAFLTGALDEGAVVGIRVTGVDPTPAGPRVRFDVPRMRRRRGDTKRLPDREAIAELVSRMVALRWKDSPEPRGIPEMHQMDLAADHPRVIGDFTETGPGWHWLLSATAGWIEETGVPEGFRASQVKEKFGTLRFYWCATGDELQANRIIEAAEWISGAVCETCGAPGKTRTGGWIRTACDAHAKRR